MKTKEDGIKNNIDLKDRANKHPAKTIAIASVGVATLSAAGLFAASKVLGILATPFLICSAAIPPFLAIATGILLLGLIVALGVGIVRGYQSPVHKSPFGKEAMSVE